jgi:hypothetical protein
MPVVLNYVTKIISNGDVSNQLTDVGRGEERGWDSESVDV